MKETFFNDLLLVVSRINPEARKLALEMLKNTIVRKDDIVSRTKTMTRDGEECPAYSSTGMCRYVSNYFTDTRERDSVLSLLRECKYRFPSLQGDHRFYWWANNEDRERDMNLLQDVLEHVEEAEGVMRDADKVWMKRMNDLLPKLGKDGRHLIKEAFPELVDTSPYAFVGDIFIKTSGDAAHNVYTLIVTEDKMFKVRNIKYNTEWRGSIKPTGYDNNKPYLSEADFLELCTRNARLIRHEDAWQTLRGTLS